MSTTKTTKVETKVADKAEAKKPEAPKAEPKKETVVKAEVKKAAAPKKEAVKAEAKKPAAKAETKKAPAKKAEPKKAPVKKAAAPKKETAKKTEEVYIEYAGSQISTAEIINKVVEATGKKASSIKTLNVYVQPEFGIAYYTVDGTEGKITY